MEDDENFKKVMDFLDQYEVLMDICNRIYIARNISLSSEGIEECLREIDVLFRDNENYN